MKLKLFLLLSFIISSPLFAQIEVGFINDFEDGTTQGWINGGTSPNPPTNIPTGGPDGEGDHFLEEISSGGSGEGSRLIVFNVNPEWQGDYNAAGVNQISFYAKNGHTEDLYLRIGFSGGVGSRMVTTAYVFLPASQTSWTYINIPITPSDFTMKSGPNTPEEVLANVNGLRIISNQSVSYYGQAIKGIMHLDNIVTENILSVEEVTNIAFEMYPNPFENVLNIRAKLAGELMIYNVLGQKMLQKELTSEISQIDLSQIKEGVYFIKLSSEKGITTKKILKK